MTKAILTITEKAASQVKNLMDVTKEETKDTIIGLRVKLATKGCSGMAYDVEYASDVKPYEEVIEDKGVKILIDSAAVMFLIGAEMDWIEEKFSSNFVFSNPNEKARCGCGESVMF